MLSRCPGCDLRAPDLDGPTHAYIESSPACWAMYGDVLAREYSDPRAFAVHRLTVDAYAAQHPGRPSKRSEQSVAVHLIALQLVLECGHPPAFASRMLARSVAVGGFVWLEPPSERGTLTVADVVVAADATDHAARVERWARAVYEAWAPHHAQVRDWAARCLG